MKKVLFMFVAVLALASCQKAAENANETASAADSAKTEAVEEKTVEAGEIKAPEKTGDAITDIKAAITYTIAKVKACKSMKDFMDLENDPVMKEFEKSMPELEKLLTPEQKQELEKWAKLPGNDVDAVMEEQMKKIMPQK